MLIPYTPCVIIQWDCSQRGKFFFMQDIPMLPSRGCFLESDRSVVLPQAPWACLPETDVDSTRHPIHTPGISYYCFSPWACWKQYGWSCYLRKSNGHSKLQVDSNLNPYPLWGILFCTKPANILQEQTTRRASVQVGHALFELCWLIRIYGKTKWFSKLCL